MNRVVKWTFIVVSLSIFILCRHTCRMRMQPANMVVCFFVNLYLMQAHVSNTYATSLHFSLSIFILCRHTFRMRMQPAYMVVCLDPWCIQESRIWMPFWKFQAWPVVERPPFRVFVPETEWRLVKWEYLKTKFISILKTIVLLSLSFHHFVHCASHCFMKLIDTWLVENFVKKCE